MTFQSTIVEKIIEIYNVFWQAGWLNFTSLSLLYGTEIVCKKGPTYCHEKRALMMSSREKGPSRCHKKKKALKVLRKEKGPSRCQAEKKGPLNAGHVP